MKDSIALLLCGLAAAAGAWAFWHVAGAFGAVILLAVSAAGLLLDNLRLRGLLRKRDQYADT
jgi:hypothetical protein